MTKENDRQHRSCVNVEKRRRKRLQNWELSLSLHRSTIDTIVIVYTPLKANAREASLDAVQSPEGLRTTSVSQKFPRGKLRETGLALAVILRQQPNINTKSKM